MKKKIAKLLEIAGVAVMLLVILYGAVMTIPKLLGLKVYVIESESMEPQYPLDSIVYVADADAEEIGAGEVITYYLGSDTTYVMTHRVIKIDKEKQEFVTKGDANMAEDIEPVAFSRLVGKVVFKIPFLGKAAGLFKSKQKLAAIFVIIFLVWLAADRLKKSKKS